MIASPQHERPASPAPEKSAAAPALLPPFPQLLRPACVVNLPVVGALLLTGHLRLALSEAGGFAISILVCGVLYLMVGRCMAYYVGAVGGRPGAGANGLAMAQMAGLLLAKFAVLGLAAYLVMSVRGISLAAVLFGFLITHIAVLAVATRHLKKR